MIRVTLYTRQDCPLCDEARLELASLGEEYPHELTELDVDSDAVLRERFGERVPVLEIGPYTLKSPFSGLDLKVALAAAQQGGGTQRLTGTARDRVLRIDRIVLALARRWLAVLNLVVGVYVGLPFLAPVLMKAGWDAPARLIYLAYRPMCHQAAFRSWFLFGEQAAYPRAIAGTDLESYEAVTGLDPYNVSEARAFVGNERTGYKVALCQRDVAIYGTLLGAGMLFGLVRRRLKPLPILAWLVIGVVPIALDGGIQILSALPFWPFAAYESTPLLRALTGGLFGLANVWMAYPYLEETMNDTIAALVPKLARAGVSVGAKVVT